MNITVINQIVPPEQKKAPFRKPFYRKPSVFNSSGAETIIEPTIRWNDQIVSKLTSIACGA